MTQFVVVFGLPVLIGAAGAALSFLFRRFLRRWVAIECLISFFLAFGVGVGAAATAMNARGYRIPDVQWLYGETHDQFERTIDASMSESALAERSQPKSCGSTEGRGGG